MKRDTGGEYVLVSQEFYYFGKNAPKVPEDLIELCPKSRDMEYLNRSQGIVEAFVKWLEGNHTVGIHGDPINWKDDS